MQNIRVLDARLSQLTQQFKSGHDSEFYRNSALVGRCLEAIKNSALPLSRDREIQEKVESLTGGIKSLVELKRIIHSHRSNREIEEGIGDLRLSLSNQSVSLNHRIEEIWRGIHSENQLLDEINIAFDCVVKRFKQVIGIEAPPLKPKLDLKDQAEKMQHRAFDEELESIAFTVIPEIIQRYQLENQQRIIHSILLNLGQKIAEGFYGKDVQAATQLTQQQLIALMAIEAKRLGVKLFKTEIKDFIGENALICIERFEKSLEDPQEYQKALNAPLNCASSLGSLSIDRNLEARYFQVVYKTTCSMIESAKRLAEEHLLEYVQALGRYDKLLSEGQYEEKHLRALEYEIILHAKKTMMYVHRASHKEGLDILETKLKYLSQRIPHHIHYYASQIHKLLSEIQEYRNEMDQKAKELYKAIDEQNLERSLQLVLENGGIFPEPLGIALYKAVDKPKLTQLVLEILKMDTDIPQSMFDFAVYFALQDKRNDIWKALLEYKTVTNDTLEVAFEEALREGTLDMAADLVKYNPNLIMKQRVEGFKKAFESNNIKLTLQLLEGQKEREPEYKGAAVEAVTELKKYHLIQVLEKDLRPISSKHVGKSVQIAINNKDLNTLRALNQSRFEIPIEDRIKAMERAIETKFDSGLNELTRNRGGDTEYIVPVLEASIEQGHYENFKKHITLVTSLNEAETNRLVLLATQKGYSPIIRLITKKGTMSKSAKLQAIEMAKTHPSALSLLNALNE